MSTPDGLRQRNIEERERKERVRKIKEESEREQLFSRGLMQQAVQPAQVARDTVQIARDTAQTQEMLNILLAGQQELLDQSNRIVETQDKQLGKLDSITSGVKNLIVKTDEILQVSKSIKRDTDALKRAYASGGATALIKEVIFNERLLLFAYFMIHPLAPITTETVLSVWLCPLSLYRTVRGVVYRDVDVNFTSVSGAVYSFTVSQPALIGLMYALVSQHAELRDVDADTYSKLFSGTLENAGVDTYGWLMGIARGEQPVSGLPDGFTSANITEQVEKMVNSIPGLWNTIEDTCPTFKNNKAKFSLCLGEYLGGQLVSTVTSISSFPGYAAQINHLVTAEGRFLGLLAQFLGTMLSYTLVGTKDSLVEYYDAGKEWLVGQASQVVKSVLGSWSPFGGKRRKLRGGQGQLQMQMQMQRDTQFNKMDMEMKTKCTVLTQASAFYLDVYELGQMMTRENLKLFPEVKRALEVNIETGVLLLSSPTLVDDPLLLPEDSKTVMKEVAFQSFRDPSFSGGRHRRKTRRGTRRPRRTARRFISKNI
jgi:hypothetical protein